jgi:hypothetical protein
MSDKKINEAVDYLLQMRAAHKKKDKKKPRTFTALETWGLVTLAGPFLLTGYYFAMQALYIAGQSWVSHLNVHP